MGREREGEGNTGPGPRHLYLSRGLTGGRYRINTSFPRGIPEWWFERFLSRAGEGARQREGFRSHGELLISPATPREMNSSCPGALPAYFLVQCSEQFEGRSRATTESPVIAPGKEHGLSSDSTHPHRALTPPAKASLPNKRIML